MFFCEGLCIQYIRQVSLLLHELTNQMCFAHWCDVSHCIRSWFLDVISIQWTTTMREGSLLKASTFMARSGRSANGPRKYVPNYFPEHVNADDMRYSVFGCSGIITCLPTKNLVVMMRQIYHVDSVGSACAVLIESVGGTSCVFTASRLSTRAGCGECMSISNCSSKPLHTVSIMEFPVVGNPPTSCSECDIPLPREDCPSWSANQHGLWWTTGRLRNVPYGDSTSWISLQTSHDTTTQAIWHGFCRRVIVCSQGSTSEYVRRRYPWKTLPSYRLVT